MHEFWYDYVKSKYGKKLKLCYMDTDTFIVYVETETFKQIKMLKQDLILPIISQIQHYLKEKKKK